MTGIDRLKDYELKLHVDESVRPVAQPVRGKPFGLREKVDKKLDELLREADIIKEVSEGPCGWISPSVVVPKGDGDVSVCGEMRRANEAIVRERHPIPTVEELLHNLDGSTVLTKVDLKWGSTIPSQRRQPTHYSFCDASWPVLLLKCGKICDNRPKQRSHFHD